MSFETALSPEERKRYLALVKNYQLSPSVIDFVERYEAVGGGRDRFLWKWVGAVFTNSGVALSSVEKDHWRKITDLKILLTMIDAIFDDTADKEKDLKIS